MCPIKANPYRVRHLYESYYSKYDEKLLKQRVWRFFNVMSTYFAGWDWVWNYGTNVVMRKTTYKYVQ